ncbi:unnamed protein product [Pleuronectes platessa]|uniref:Secreted protein n=1 Tax=Pleuronectes platessa TaxID=8262 RepID=A0A9N7TW04_PLEPL|nr:unnamed protein product [Pleuronectes platessa]
MMLLLLLILVVSPVGLDRDLQSERLRGPGISILCFFRPSPLRLPHTLIPARAERGCSLNQQPGRKCEERRAGCIIDFGQKRRIQPMPPVIEGDPGGSRGTLTGLPAQEQCIFISPLHTPLNTLISGSSHLLQSSGTCLI